MNIWSIGFAGSLLVTVASFVAGVEAQDMTEEVAASASERYSHQERARPSPALSQTVPVYSLPFDFPGCIVQGTNSGGSHSGYAAWSMDFVNIAPLGYEWCNPQDGQPPVFDGDSQGMPVYAAKGGWLAYVYADSIDNCTGALCSPRPLPSSVCTPCASPTIDFERCLQPANEIILEHPSEGFSNYMHLEYDSIPNYIIDAFYWGGPLWIDEGTYLGNVGSTGGGTGDHLHFSHYSQVTINGPGTIQPNPGCGYSFYGGPSGVQTAAFEFGPYFRKNGWGWTYTPEATPLVWQVVAEQQLWD